MDFSLSSPTAVANGVVYSSLPSFQQPSGLDHRAMETIRSLDSRSFGFLDFHQNERNSQSGCNSSVDTSYITRDFIRQGITKLQEDLRTGPQSDTFQSSVYCRLGHLHLLLEEYHQALSAYQRYQQLSPLESSSNPTVLYGLGLIYFSMNSYKWANDCFMKVLSQNANFARAGEIHLRLGVMFKTKGDYSSSIDHFHKALAITGPASFSRLETQFHLGHIHYLQGLYPQAREAFEGILATKSVPNSIRAMTLRQLGWLYHTVPSVAGPGEDPNNKATELLKLAVGADAVSSQAWYFLGRCHATQGRAREAFLAYQQAISKAVDGEQADIWCSIGILYHNMGQPKDSLQAYLCALYLDPYNLSCWSNLGCLYEAVSQPVDALLCYKNAVTYHKKLPPTGKYPEFVFSRVANLEQYLSVVGPAVHQQPRPLPTLLEAWHCLVPSHIKERKAHTEMPLLQLPNLLSSPSPTLSLPHDHGVLPFSSGGLSPSPSHGQLGFPPPAKKFKSRNNKSKDPIIIKSMQESWTVLGVSAGGHQVPNFSQFSPTNLQSLQQHQSSSPVPFTAQAPGIGTGNENVTVHHGNSGIGMGFESSSSTTSITDASGLGRLQSTSSSRASMCGSIHDLSMTSGSSSNAATHRHNHNSMAGSSTMLDSLQSLEDPLPSSVPPSPLPLPFVSGSSTVIAPALPGAKATPTTGPASSSSSSDDSLGGTSLIAKPPSMLTDPSTLHLSPSSSSSLYSSLDRDPSLLGVHQVQTLPNNFNTATAMMGVATSYGLPPQQPHPFGPETLHGGALPSHGNLPPSSYHLPHGSMAQHAPHDFISSSSSHSSTHGFASSTYPRVPPPSSSVEASSLVLPPSDVTANPDSLSPPSLPIVQVDNELARAEEYMQRYLSESHSQESLKNGAILSSTKDQDNLISQVLLMSPNHSLVNSQRRSSGATTARFLSMLEGAESNERGTPFAAGASNGQDDRLTRKTSSEGLATITSLNLQRANDSEHVSSSASTPCSETSPLASQTHHHHQLRETNSDTSSGFSSASTKLSTTCSSGQSSPVGLSSPANSPSVSPSPTFGEKFKYPSLDDRGERERTESQSSCVEGLLDQIYEPYPALSNDEGEYMVENPNLRPPVAPKLKGKIDLHPEVPIYEVFTKEEAMSEKLHALCCAHDVPICMVRGLTEVLDLDLQLFSSESLVKTCGEQEIEVRIQAQQAADENTDPSGRRQIWKCESSRSKTTIREYSKYQKTFSEDEVVEDDKEQRKDSRKTLEFGTNVDLSDSKVWEVQLNELTKLPKFLRVHCPEGNFLSHIGHTILGMNSVQLYMKVPGARTPGHQENNNFCSVNVNIGPGDCEWFAVHNKYWGVFHRLCEKHKVNFLVGSWWPVLNELYDLKVPVYRFTQHKGDLVWLNPGTVHWVQANRVCNNIAWNAGPLTAHQFRMSWERYRWNKVQRVRSIVPMIHLTWNLVRTIKIVNETLYQQLRALLESSLAQCQRLLAHLKKAGIPIVWHGRVDEEPAPCCNNCLEEVFNVLFVLTNKGEYLVYCHRCATAMRKSFTVLQQYHIEELEDILQSFKLHTAHQIHST